MESSCNAPINRLHFFLYCVPLVARMWMVARPLAMLVPFRQQLTAEMHPCSHKILREIAPDNFLEGGVKQNVGTNAILKWGSRNRRWFWASACCDMPSVVWAQANNITKLMKDLDTYYRGVFLQNFDLDTVNPTAVAAGQADEVSLPFPPLPFSCDSMRAPKTPPAYSRSLV
eukprot:3938739-Rhodomonas_salina.1